MMPWESVSSLVLGISLGVVEKLVSLSSKLVLHMLAFVFMDKLLILFIVFTSSGGGVEPVGESEVELRLEIFVERGLRVRLRGPRLLLGAVGL